MRPLLRAVPSDVQTSALADLHPAVFNVVVKTATTTHAYQAIGYHASMVELFAREQAGDEPVGVTVTPSIASYA